MASGIEDDDFIFHDEEHFDFGKKAAGTTGWGIMARAVVAVAALGAVGVVLGVVFLDYNPEDHFGDGTATRRAAEATPEPRTDCFDVWEDNKGASGNPYAWEDCAWEGRSNSVLSVRDAGLLVERVWRLVDLPGKERERPAVVGISGGRHCGDFMAIGCYSRADHTILLRHPIEEKTVLHETAHALLSDYRHQHDDGFACVAQHVYFMFAGVPKQFSGCPPIEAAAPNTAPATPEPTPTPARYTVVDEYWGGDYYYIVVENTPDGYCEVNLTNNGRRIGEWTNDNGSAGERTFDFFLPELLGRPEFDGYEIECR